MTRAEATNATMNDAFPQRGEVAALMRAKDWSKTPLGPPQSWSTSLRAVLRLMLTSRYAMWLGWGPDLLFFYNDAYREQTLGKKHPEALGRPTRDVWAEIWSDQLEPRITQVLESGEASWEEGLLLFLERNGYPEETYHTFSYSPATDDAGAVAGLFCVVIEESERVIGERRLALQRELASALTRASTTAEVTSGLEQTLTSGSRDVPFSLLYLFDETSEGATARLVSRSGIEAAAAPDAPWQLDAVRRDGKSVDVRLGGDIPWPAGPWRRPPENAIVLPVPQAGHTRPAGAFVAALNPHRPLDAGYRSFLELFVGQLAAGLDNARAYETERKRAEALAEIDRAKTAFFSNVSHEFRTPLTLMIGPTEDALASPERVLRGEELEVVHRNELRLLKLVNALLDFSRIEAGRVEARYEATDLSALTVDLASAFRSAMERGGLRYDVDCAPLAEAVYVDRDMWEKIVLNLLSNALKFTLEGHVRVALARSAEGVELVVEDSGPGIAAEELPRMFERFHRIEGTMARTHEGSGIGLALVRDLVELHRGQIRVESELGRGTRFVVTLPVGRAHLRADQIHEGGAQARTEARVRGFVTEALRWLPAPDATPADVESRADSSSKSKVRILVADDNADMRDYVVRLLRQHWSVDAVADGEQALEAIRADPPDLVLSDVMMPRLDGFGLVRRLRADPETKTIPVILLSARAGQEATGEGLESGANDYLIKPFSARDLVARVSSQLAIASIRKQAESEKESQRRVVETLFMNAPAGITLLDGQDLTIRFANPMALEIWGKTRDVIGKPLLEALPELEGRGFDALLREVMRTGNPYSAEEVPITFRERDGREVVRYLNFVYAAAENEHGVIGGAAAFGFEVTAQVLGRQRALLSATVGRAFVFDDGLVPQLERCCAGLVAFGAAGALVWTHDQGRDLLDLRASAGAIPVSARQPTVRVGSPGVGAVASSGVALMTKLADAAEVVMLTAHPLRVGGRLVGVLAVYWRHELPDDTLAALAVTADQIALGIERDSSERFRDLFIGMLGHDLRNPLNAVNVAGHVLSSGVLSDHQRRTVARLRAASARMARMIDQVLDFTRARSGGGIPVQRVRSDIHAICAQAVDELATAHPDREIIAEYRGDASGAWDPDRLAQVFSNLIGNAITYSPVGTPVRVSIDGERDRIDCMVHNMGAPIPAASLPTLFDPFRRAAHGKSAGTRGLGLGLFIAHQIVLAHGGRVVVSSSDDEGTRFSFTLLRAEAS